MNRKPSIEIFRGTYSLSPERFSIVSLCRGVDEVLDDFESCPVAEGVVEGDSTDQVPIDRGCGVVREEILDAFVGCVGVTCNVEGDAAISAFLGSEGVGVGLYDVFDGISRWVEDAGLVKRQDLRRAVGVEESQRVVPLFGFVGFAFADGDD